MAAVLGAVYESAVWVCWVCWVYESAVWVCCSGSGLKTGLCGGILAGYEVTQGEYPLTVSLLKLMATLVQVNRRSLAHAGMRAYMHQYSFLYASHKLQQFLFSFGMPNFIDGHIESLMYVNDMINYL